FTLYVLTGITGGPSTGFPDCSSNLPPCQGQVRMQVLGSTTPSLSEARPCVQRSLQAYKVPATLKIAMASVPRYTLFEAPGGTSLNSATGVSPLDAAGARSRNCFTVAPPRVSSASQRDIWIPTRVGVSRNVYEDASV